MLYWDKVGLLKVSNHEMCWIFEYPSSQLSEMIEQDIQLLKENNINGKVVLDLICVLAVFDNAIGRVPASSGVSVVLVQEDITNKGIKKKLY